MLLGSGPAAGRRQDLEKSYIGFKLSCLGHVAVGRHEEESQEANLSPLGRWRQVG